MGRRKSTLWDHTHKGPIKYRIIAMLSVDGGRRDGFPPTKMVDFVVRAGSKTMLRFVVVSQLGRPGVVGVGAFLAVPQ
jgi:hypothetical protein